MRYWWVNHNLTALEELRAGYLWSPIREANGARSQFYENMRIAAPGDTVLSFSGGLIRHYGIVQDFASPALKPESFTSSGNNWSLEGWILPVAWKPLKNSIRPKDYISELGPLLPSKYSPMHPISGNGNQKAYLAEIDHTAFQFLIRLAGSNLETLSTKTNSDPILTQIDDALQTELSNDPHLDSTTKEQLVLARKGQGVFRSKVFEFEKACRLTQVETPTLLVASHIKPWRVCASALERLDGANGLLLAPHVDRLFDRGLISFNDDGSVLISSKLANIDLVRLGLASACSLPGVSFHRRQTKYLSFHRERVLLP